MLSEDAEVWTAFLAWGEYPLEGVWYDVRVGEGIPVADTASDLEQRIGKAVGQKRIDVVCMVRGVLWVVELKPRLNMMAVGQVVTYAELFVVEYRPAVEVWPAVICFEVDADMVRTLETLGIKAIEVERTPRS